MLLLSFHRGGNGALKRMRDLLRLTQPVNKWQVSLLLVSPSSQYSLQPFQELSLNAAGSYYQGARLQTR